MRKVYTILMSIVFVLVFTTCTPYTANIDTYLSYWSAETYITDSTVKSVVQNDVSSIPSVPSAKDVSVTLKLHNPKSFPLDLPPEADAAKNVVVFEHLDQAPVVGTDYTLTQSEDRQNLILTYKASFLQAHEWGEQDLSSILTLYAADGRKFKQTYTFKIKANTPPPTPGFTVAKTAGTPAYYVLCITVPAQNMKATVQGSRFLHKDITRIEVNGTQYPFSVNEAENRFEKPESDLFIAYSDVETLGEPDADTVPSGGWVLYYKTDVEVKDGAAKKDYTVRLADAKDLVSGILNASTKPNKADAEKVDITKGNISGSGSGSEGDPVIIVCDSTGAELKVSSVTAGVTVHGTLTDTGTAESTQYNENPITVPLPLHDADEKNYQLEYYTDGEGFARTDVKTVYYKILKGHTVTFDANTGAYPDGSTSVSNHVQHGSTVSAPNPQPKKEGYYLPGWYKDQACSAGQEWNFTADTVSSDITLYAKWVAGTGPKYTVTFSVAGGNGKIKADSGSFVENGTIEVEHGGSVIFTADPGTGYAVAGWTVSPGSFTPGSGTNQSATLSNITAGATVTVKFFENTISGDASSYEAWKKLRQAVNEAPAGGTIVIDGLVQSTNASGNNGEIIVDKDLTIQGKSGAASDILDANESAFSTKTEKHRIFRVKGGKKLTLKKLTLKNGYVENAAAVGGYGTRGGGILLESGTVSLIDVTISNCKAVTDTPYHGDGAGIYAISGNIIMENATLSANNASAYGGAVYLNGGTLTMKGSTVVTPSTGGNANKTGKNDVHLKDGAKIIADGELTGSVPVARIRVAVKEYLPTRQVLDGTAVGSNFTKFTVTDQELGYNNGYSHARKWNIASNGYLQSEVVTIDGSKIYAWQALRDAVRTAFESEVIAIKGEIKATDTDLGIYSDYGEITVDKNISIKKADSAASAVLDANSNELAIKAHRIFTVERGKTLTLANLTLKGGKAAGADDGTGSGGAIFVNGGTVKITNCILTGNIANKNGGALWAEKEDDSPAEVIINSSTIGGTGGDGNTVNDPDGFGGGIVINDGTLNLTDTNIIGNEADRGGGIRTNKSRVIMTGCTIAFNKATGTGNDDGGGGVYTHEGTLTMTDCTLTGNTANGAAYGGGMAIENTTVTMTGCTLKGNTASDGGGIYTRYLANTPPQTTVTIDGGTIGGTQSDEANKATGSSGGFGGGIFVDKNYIVTLKGNVQIIGNTAKDGGGVYANINSTFKMYDSTIAGNAATANGKGVYVKGGDGTPTEIGATFIMGGTACVGKWNGALLEDGNDVYLDSNLHGASFVSIKIDKDNPITQSKVARITPKNYDNTQTVLRMSNASTAVEAYNDKFTVTPQPHTPSPPDYIYWIVDTNGVLKDVNTIPYSDITKELLESVDSFMSSNKIEGGRISPNKNIFYRTTCGFYGVMQITRTDDMYKPSDGNYRLRIHFKYKTFNHDGSVKQSGEKAVLDHAETFKLCDGGILPESTTDTDNDLYFSTGIEYGNNGKIKRRWLDKLEPCRKARFLCPEF